MWLITRETTGEVFPILSDVDEYKVGRLTADLVLRDDKSISGTHAFLRAKLTLGSEEYLELEDAGSKNGTFRNEGITSRKPLVKNKPIKLNNGDRIQFGVIGNLWIVSRFQFCSVSSGLTPDEETDLEQFLLKLNGKHIPKWDDTCNYLTMNEVRVTIKVMYALLAEISIVNINYWRDLVKIALREKKGPLSSDDYIPRASDVLLARPNIDFHKRSERRSIFAGKTFVFLNQKHFETYGAIVEKAGGVSRDLKSGVQKVFLLKKNVVVIQYMPSTESQNTQGTQTINGIREYLEKNSRRFIPEYEIALAIIHCSTEKYCNPDFKIISNIISGTSTLRDSVSLIVENTSVTNDQLGSDYCSLLILETESSQLLNEVEQNRLTSPIQVTTSITNVNSNSEIDYADKKSRKKRGRHNVINSDNESCGENEPIIKKMHVENTLKQNCENPLNNMKTKPATKVGNLNRFISLDICNAKTQQEINMPNVSDDEDDIFNFGDKEVLSVPEPKKSQSESHFSGNNVENNINSNDNNSDLVSTQTFAAKKKMSTELLPKPKTFPQKLSSEGWLASLCKSEFNISKSREIFTKHDEDVENDDSRAGTFKGGFHIKIRILSSLSINKSQFNKIREIVSTPNISQKEKNNKKFIKQQVLRNYR